MNTNMMEAMGGNGALGKRRRKKRTNNLIEKVNSKIDQKDSNVTSRIGRKVTNLTEKIDQMNKPHRKKNLIAIYFEKLNKKFQDLDDDCMT
jgi:hypothetical protein